ncbi:Hypothetical predicted protein [Paramuricea clavata]|uniref:Uncharacterized protein n=2 Tax=Paramuricea clavata TaxID=317549 RepID=A0A7D9EYE8_PARCT|nr:Hypothetical predicted protein [Paramuricea clavata]
MPEISLKKTPKSQATPDVIENLTSSIREMVIRGNQQPDENQFQSEVLSARTFDIRETPKTFVSKIPKPVNRRLSQTPDVTTNKSMAVRRRSLTTTKKPKRTRGDGVKMEKVDTKKGFPNTGVTGSKDGSQRKVVGEKKLHVTNTNASDHQFRTPLATGTRSSFMKQHSSARNILAEKIAAAVFSDEPSSLVGSTQSSSEDNTPKDLAIADPLGNLTEAPFISKDLIPRTPFKRDKFLLDPNDDDGPGSMKSHATDHNMTTTNKQCPSVDATLLLESPLLEFDTTVMNNGVSKSNTKSPIRYLQQTSPTAHVMSPFESLTSCKVQVSPSPVVSFGDLVKDQSTSVSSKTVNTAATSGTTHVSSDIILQYQRLKKAQETNGLLQNNSPQTPEIFTRPTIGNGENLATVSGGEDSGPRLQPPSVSASYIMPPSHTTNPALLRYQQWKKVQEVFPSSGTKVTSPRLQSTGVMVSGASLTPEIKSHNLLQHYQVGSHTSDVTSPHPRSTDIMASRASHALEMMSHNLLLGNHVGTYVSSPSLHSPPLKVDDMLTPFMNGHHGLLRGPKPELSMVADDVINDVDDITRSHQPATHVTYSKGFATPMVSSMGNHFYEFGQTPLDHIAPPMDFTGNSFHRDRRESVRSRLSFDFDTPGSSLRTSLAQQGYLNTPSAREIANMKRDDVIGQKEFKLIPVNTDDLFQDEYRLPFEENIGDFKKDIEPENVKEEQRNSSVENTDTTEVSIDSTPHVEVGQLIEFD